MATDMGSYRVGRPFKRLALNWLVGPALIVGLTVLLDWLGGPAAGGLEASGRTVLQLIAIVAIGAISVGLVNEFRRSRGPALEVDAAGIRVAGMPWLAWSDVAELRDETIVFGFSGSTHADGEVVDRDRTAAQALAATDISLRRRLGIVPVDRGLAERGATAGLVSASMRSREGNVRRLGGTPIDLAPFGVYDWELRAPFDEVVGQVSRFHSIVTLSDLAGASG